MNDIIIGTVKNPIKIYHGNKDANMVYPGCNEKRDYTWFYVGEIINE